VDIRNELILWAQQQPDLVPQGHELSKAREILVLTGRLLLLWVCQLTPESTLEEFEALSQQAESYVCQGDEEPSSVSLTRRPRRRRRSSMATNHHLKWGLMFGMGVGLGMSMGVSFVYCVLSAGRKAREQRMASFLLQG